ncbi:MAG: hypothetical protein HPY50_21425 [Firmicutes bacterium]|nr:hypothetical protein [Bacillota bacterium]
MFRWLGKIKKCQSPWVALLWSLAIPGFGQLYNRDYLIGLVLVALEIVINVNANLNLAILYSFRGRIAEVYQVANFQWLLFYPCVYTFSLWQAYNKALAIRQGSDETAPRLSGIFLGLAMGGTLGVIYSSFIGPVFTGIAGGMVGAVIGFSFEYLVSTRKR